MSKKAHRIDPTVQEFQPNEKSLTPKTKAQDQLIKAIRSQTVVFASGPAGTGKTYVCSAMACQELASRRIGQIIITRPAVEAGEHLGFLPGELEDKYTPYLEPFMGVFHEWFGSHTEYLMKRSRIVAKPLAYMRGATYKDAWIILDEAQNTTVTQMKMFLTRFGENSKVLITGDPTQQDIHGVSGFQDAISRLSKVRGVATVNFFRQDSVRHPMIQDILLAYER